MPPKGGRIGRRATERAARSPSTGADTAETALAPETLRRMLYYMKLHRAIEDRIEIRYRQGKLVGAVFTGRGHEAIGVGTASHLGEHDVIFPTHRDLGAYLVKGMLPRAVFLQYLGRRDGPTRGRDGNMHMGDWSLGIGAFVSHMADTVPVAAGVALAFKARKQPTVVVCHMGDGATSRGDWHEGLNLAAVLQVPVVYVCVNNQYAYSTPLKRQMAVPNIVDRAAGYGMPIDLVDGNDVLAVYESARLAVARARGGGGPSFLECLTYRMSGHGAHDDAQYVPKEFLEEGRRRDPIERFTRLLRDRRAITDNELHEIERRIDSEVEQAWIEAEASPAPDGPDTLDGVYAP